MTADDNDQAARELLYQRARNTPSWVEYVLSGDEKRILRRMVDVTWRTIRDFRRALWSEGDPKGILWRLCATGHTVMWEHIDESVHWEDQLWRYEDMLRSALDLPLLDRSTHEEVLWGEDCY